MNILLFLIPEIYLVMILLPTVHIGVFDWQFWVIVIPTAFLIHLRMFLVVAVERQKVFDAMNDSYDKAMKSVEDLQHRSRKLLEKLIDEKK